MRYVALLVDTMDKLECTTIQDLLASSAVTIWLQYQEITLDDPANTVPPVPIYLFYQIAAFWLRM